MHLSGHAANYPWVPPLNPRYLGKAMQDHQSCKTIKHAKQDHQALKTIRTEINNVLTTEFFKDQEPAALVLWLKVNEDAADATRSNGS